MTPEWEPRPIGLLNELNEVAKPLGLLVLHDGATPVQVEDGTRGLFKDWRFKVSKANPDYDPADVQSSVMLDNPKLRGMTADQVRAYLASVGR